MNKTGSTLIYGIMLMIMALIVAIVCITPVKQVVEIARDSSHLDCSNASISSGTQLTCLVVDLYLFYFIGAVLAASSGYLFIKSRGG